MRSSSAQLEQGEVGNAAQHTPKGAGYRLERTVWIVMLLLPLLAYCVVAVLALSIKPTPIHTGDALYDKYLAWVADDLVENYSTYDMFGIYLNDDPSEVDLDPFADWEAEFGDDPRYWMLRYRYSKGEVEGEWGYRHCDPSHLERARELGVADGAILLILLNQSDNKVWEQFRYDIPGRRNLKDTAEVEKYQREKVDELMGAEHNQLLAELLEVAGDESLPHYYSAMFDSQRGDFAAAIDHLADGNRAPNNSSLTGFPFENLRTDTQAGNPLPDKVVSGSIVVDEMAVALPNFIQIKTMVKLLVADAISRGDRAALDEIHTFSYRFGRAAGNGMIFTLVGSILAGIVEKELLSNQGISLNVKEASNLAKLTNMRSQVRAQIKTLSGNSQLFNTFGTPNFQMLILVLEGQLSGGRGFSAYYLEAVNTGFVNEQAVLCSVHQVFEQMESFNYNTLEFE